MKNLGVTFLLSILSCSVLAQKEEIRSEVKLRTNLEPQTLKPITYEMPLRSSGSWGSKNYKEGLIDHLEIELAKVISDNWFIEKTDTSIVLTYCRSCQELYKKYEDSVTKISLAWRDTVRVVTRNNPQLIRESELHYTPVWREDFFEKYGPDSITFHSPLSGNALTTEEEEKLLYEPEDILRIEIQFEEVWSEKKIQRIQSRNDSLKIEILKTPLYKTITSFDDYRAYLPQKYLRKRTERFEYNFERLPYESNNCKYSIFLLGNKDELCAETILVDKNDPLFFKKSDNHIEKERRSTIILIAYILGLKDFEYIGQ